MSPIIRWSYHNAFFFAGTLASTDAATTAYGDGDVLVELGTLNTDLPGNLVTGSKFFIHRALIGITTAAGQTLVGGLSLSATSGTATNAAVSSGTEIVGAGGIITQPVFAFPGGHRFHFTEPGGSEFAAWSDCYQQE